MTARSFSGTALPGSAPASRGAPDPIIADPRAADTTRGAPSFTLRNRLYRAAWAVAWTLLASWTPPPLFGWRRMLLRVFGAQLAPSARIYQSARVWSPANLSMGDYACLGPRTNVYNMAMIKLDAFAVVSQGAHLCAGTHDIEDPQFQLKAFPISIGSHAWVGAEAFVGPGVQIGQGAVLGARAVAMRDIMPWTVCAGNPAIKVRDRRIRFGDHEEPSSTQRR